MANTVKNTNILITGTEFVNNSAAVIVTTNDRGDPKYLDKSNAQEYAAQNITLENSVIENTGDTYKKMLHVKDSYDIHWNNVTLLGTLHEVKLEDRYNIGLPKDVSGTNVSTGPARSSVDDAAYRDLAGPDWSDLSYPTSGTPTPPNPEPISYTPPPAPDPVEEPAPTPDPVEEPDTSVDSDVVEETDPFVFAPSTDSANFPSKLLNIYLAFSDTDENVHQFGDESSINSALTEGRPLTIYASSQDGAPAIGSVNLEVAGVISRMENAEPYALFGDDGKGDFKGNKKWQDGTYSVTLTAFEGKNGSGKKLEEVTFDFTIDAQSSTPTVISDPVTEPVVVAPEPETDLAPDVASSEPNSELINISLIDTSTDKAFATIQQGTKLSSDDLEGRKITISAESIDRDASDIGSMKLELDGLYSRIENSEPFALFGDYKGNFFGGKPLEDGTHFATLTAYSGKNGKGSILEEVTVQFEVGDYDSVIVGGTASAVSRLLCVSRQGTATVSTNQMSVELEGSAWKSLDHVTKITEMTVMKVEFKSDAEGEIQALASPTARTTWDRISSSLMARRILAFRTSTIIRNRVGL